MTVKSMLAAARKSLGLRGRPNYITRDYAKRHGSEFLSAPWCNQAVTYWARVSGNAHAVLPNGDRAYTPWHANDGHQLGLWHAGTVENLSRHAKPGAVIFFDWGGSNSIGAIDHIGIVEKNLGGGRVQTIEGNSGDACVRRVRSASVIAGFWNPKYTSEEDDVSAKDVWTFEIPVTYGSEKNPSWQARNVLVNHGEHLRKIEAKLDAMNATVKALAEALAARDGAVDVDALVARIHAEIESISVRLDVV